MPSVFARLIVIVVVLALAGIAIWLFSSHHGTPSQGSAPSIPSSAQVRTDSVKSGGVYFLGSGDRLIYRDLSGAYYDAGGCNDCLAACSGAIQVTDVYKFLSCADLPPTMKNLCPDDDQSDDKRFVPVLLKTAKEYTDELLSQSSGKITTADCLATLNGGVSGQDKLQDQQVLKTVADFMNSGSSSIWDYLSAHKEAITELITQFGDLIALQKVLGEFGPLILMMPLLETERGRLNFGVMTGFMLSAKVWKSYIRVWLSSAIESLSVKTEEKIMEEVGEHVMEYALRLTVEIAMRFTVNAVKFAVMEVMMAITELTDGLFFFADIVMLVGMIVDAFDPCGLNDVFSQADMDAINTGWNNAYYLNLLQSYKSYPVEWYYENVVSSGIICGLGGNSTQATRLTIDMLSVPDRAPPSLGDDPTDPCDADNQVLRSYTNLYFNNLKVNSLGQCIQTVTNDYLTQRMRSMGFPVNDISGKGFQLHASDFSKALDYLDMQFANQNVIVARYIKRYWVWVLLFVIMVVVIAFML